MILLLFKVFYFWYWDKCLFDYLVGWKVFFGNKNYGMLIYVW